MTIRKCTDSDLKSLFTVYQQARSEKFFKEQAKADFQSFKSILEDEEQYCALIGDQITAFISVYPPQSFVHHLYVLPVFQRKGIGSELINYIRKVYESPLSLKCEKGNKPAIQFYKRMGWEIFNTGSEIDGTEYILLTLDLD